MLSLACTLSTAQPFCPSSPPVNDAAIRNINGASGVYLNDHVAITVTQAYIERSRRRPHGGVQFAISNVYCFNVLVTFTLDTGTHYSFTIPSGAISVQTVVPENVMIGHVIHVNVQSETGL
jgi:hypothetical protein